jgi:hypothetical protein
VSLVCADPQEYRCAAAVFVGDFAPFFWRKHPSFWVRSFI